MHNSGDTRRMRAQHGNTTGIQARRAGFTLLESLIVIILLGLVASFAMPAFERSANRSRADRAANVVVNDLRNAFSLAERQRKPIRISIDAAGRRYTIIDRASSTVLVRRDLGTSSPFRLSGMTTTRVTVDVFPNGLASATLGVGLTLGSNSRTVSMTRAGLVRMQ